LYVGILVPDIKDVKKDISAEIYQINNSNKKIISVLDGSNFKWTPFYEEFGKDNYFWGPEFKSDDSQKGVDLKGEPVPAGKYIIRVYSPSNTGKYSLVTGYKEEFPLSETLNTIIKVPQLKLFFFNESLIKVFSTVFVWLPVLIILVLAIIIYFTVRYVVRKISRR
jgi:hypothetical protein